MSLWMPIQCTHGLQNKHFADSITSLVPGDTVSISNCTESQTAWRVNMVQLMMTGPWASGLYRPFQTTTTCTPFFRCQWKCPTHLSVHWTALEGILGATRCCLLTGEKGALKMKGISLVCCRREEKVQRVNYPLPPSDEFLLMKIIAVQREWTSESGHSMRDWWGSRGHVVRSEQSW